MHKPRHHLSFATVAQGEAMLKYYTDLKQEIGDRSYTGVIDTYIKEIGDQILALKLSETSRGVDVQPVLNQYYQTL